LNFSLRWRSIVALGLALGFLSACSLDPNVRKQKDFESGKIFFAKGQYAAAASEFGKAVKIDPAYADAHYQLGESYMLLGQSDRAVQEFSRTVDLRPDDYSARLAMANLLVLGHNFAPAKEQAEWLLKNRPNDPAVHAAVSSLLAEQGDLPGAIAEMQKTINLAPNYWEPYLSLALLQAKNGQTDAAEASFKKVIAMDAKQDQPRVLLGRFYQSENRPADAEQQFRDAMALTPGDMSPREALAKVYEAEGKGSAAEGVLEQANKDLPHDPESLLALSNFYFTSGNLDKAVAEYDALYRERPNDLNVKKKYIQLLIQTKHYEAARSLVNGILKSNASDSDALVYRSEMEISAGDVNDAAQTLQTVVGNAPRNSEAHYVLGVALDKQGFAERAESEWRQALDLDPDSVDAERALADAALQKGDMSALQDAANQLIRMEPEAPEGYALRALSSINRNQFDAAERDVQRAIDVAPQNAYGYVQLGNLRLAEKQYNDAAKAFQDALDRNPDSVDALRGLMSTYAAQKQTDKAIAAAKAQIGKVPANSGFYDLLGAALFHFANDLNGAETALENSVALDGSDADAVIQLCQVEAEKGEMGTAIATGQQGLKQNPRQAGISLVLGDLYAAQSDWKDAESAYQNAVTINSLNPVALNDLARAMVHAGGSLDSAMSLAQTARRAMPESPAVVDTMGWIYFERGEYSMAIDSLEQAMALERNHAAKDDPDIEYHLGMAYEKANQPALAREHFEHVLKTDPNYRSAAEVKAELIRLKS
jgi:cellulose synthase operon protein C